MNAFPLAEIAAVASSERGRVLVIALDFPPCRVIGAQACAQNARYLPLHGWKPIVLTVRESYFDKALLDDKPAFPGPVIRTRALPHPIRMYRALKGKLTAAGGDRGNAGGASGRDPQGLRRWVLSLLQTPDIETGWIAPAVTGGLAAIRRHQITHIFSSAPAWTNHLVGYLLAVITGLPWTAHFRDPWTDAERPSPDSAISRRLERWMERLVIRRADAVVCVTEAHTRLLQRKFNDIASHKFFTVPNGYDEAEWNHHKEDRQDQEKFVITYCGSLYGNRSPRPLFAAIRRCIDSGSIAPDAVRIDLFGHCESAEGMPDEYGLGDVVRIGGNRKRTDVLQRLGASSLLLLLGEGLDLQIPGKTYEYLRAGVPILALTSEGGALAELLRKTGGAWIVEPDDIDGIARAVREAFDAWRLRRRPNIPDRAAVARFDRRELAGELAHVLEDLPMR